MSGATILCASINPAMDRRLRVARLAVGEINRAASAAGYAGGKAAHVAMAARAMSSKAVWIGFLGGPIGQECARQMESLGIQVVPIPTLASTRVNLEIVDDAGGITEVLEPGGEPTEAEREDFWREFVLRMQDEPNGALVVISGSLPAGVGPEFYLKLIEAARAAGARVYVDTSGEALRASVRARPDFVKTNRAEGEGLLGRKLGSIDDAVAAAQEIVRDGVRSAAITMGKEGLVWVESKTGPAWVARPPRLQVVSTVGCGDATLAGFARAATQQITGEAALRLATACGAANCLAVAPGRIERAAVEALVPQIELQKL